MWGRVMKQLMEFVYPKDCVGCGELGVWLCDKCKLEFEEVVQICPMCGKESIGGGVHKKCSKRLGLDGLTAVYDHREKVMSKLLRVVKFEFNKKLLLGLVELLDFEVDREFDVVVPIPLGRYRRNWRGFNQAEVVAGEVGRQLGLPMVEALKRVRDNKQQSRTKGRKERFENVKGVFEVTGEVGGKKVLLVDDVFTSGATMREAGKALKRAGVREVWGLALTRRV